MDPDINLNFKTPSSDILPSFGKSRRRKEKKIDSAIEKLSAPQTMGESKRSVAKRQKSSLKEKKYDEAFEKAKAQNPATKPRPSIPLEPLVKQPDDVRHFLDEHRLLQGEAGDEKINPTYFEWFLGQAVIFEHLDHVDEATKQKLLLGLLQSYTKAAPYGIEKTDALQIQTSPLLPDSSLYHRSTESFLHKKIVEDFKKDMHADTADIELVHSTSFRDVLRREISPIIEIDSVETFEKVLEDFFNDYLKSRQSYTYTFWDSMDRQVFDFSKLLANHPTELSETIALLEERFIEKFNEFISQHSELGRNKSFHSIVGHTVLLAFTTHKDQNVLLIPEFLVDQNQLSIARFNPVAEHMEQLQLVKECLSRNGFRPSPDQMKMAWLKVKGSEGLQELGLPKAELATQGKTTPTVCEDFATFVNLPLISKFRNLSSEKDASPYLRILPEATVLLLEGLAKNGGIDKIYEDEGLKDILQTAYFRMQNAMKEAILRKDDYIAFNNQIEIIHQEMQGILAIVEPYREDELENCVIDKLTRGEEPVVPADLDPPQVNLKWSGMHCLASVISAVEESKGSTSLNIGVLRDTYYESSNTLKKAKEHTVLTLDGEQFRKHGIEEAFEGFSTRKGSLQTFPTLDLFVAEFHHNISLTSKSYHRENVTEQVVKMVEAGITSDKFTVVLDTTSDLEVSEDVREFLNHEKIKQLIQEGKLNVVLIRSAQKLDMLGLDNYYGGIAISVNDKAAFDVYNHRMAAPREQLGGLSYQGLTHLQKYGGTMGDAYRLALMENTRKLYDMLSPNAKPTKKRKNIMQISRIEDNRLLFIDIKFPKHPFTAIAFLQRLHQYAEEKNLPLTGRQSFGYAASTITNLDGSTLRFNPGLDDQKTLNQYAAFFHDVQEILENARKAGLDDDEIADRLSS